MQKSVLLTSLLALSQAATAGTYETLGGHCSTLGTWTQEALANTNTLIDTINQLKDNPKCKGIESIVSDLQISRAGLERPDKNGEIQARLETIPREMHALRSMGASQSQNGNVTNLLLDKSIEQATLTAATGGYAAVALRARNLAINGINALDKSLKVLPSYSECLVNAPSQGLAILAAATKMTAAYSASEENIGTSVANVIASITTFMREKKFAKAIRKLNTVQLMASMSCLLETINQSYCSAVDNRRLLDWGIKSLSLNLDPQKKYAPNLNNEKPESTPLAGYYVLIRNLPVITAWVQKLIQADEPRLLIDGKFRTGIFENVNHVQKVKMSVLGILNQSITTMQTMTNSQARNYLLDVLDDVVGTITNTPQGIFMNFYTQVVRDIDMPFYLMGLTTPDAVLGKGGSNFNQNWKVWMSANMNNAAFANPRIAIETIKANLKSLIDESQERANAYYNDFMIYDQPRLVVEALTGQNLSVYQSLIATRNYLAAVEERFNRYQPDQTLIKFVQDTSATLTRVINAFNKVRLLGNEPLDLNSKEGREKLNAAYTEVIALARNEFRVSIAREAFLSGRIREVVVADYTVLVNHMNSLDSYTKELMRALDKRMLETVLSVNGGNPAQTRLDLDTALVVNKRNLEVFEEVFGDNLVSIMEESRLRSDGKTGFGALSDAAYKRLVKESYTKAFRESPLLSIFIASNTHLLGPGPSMLWQKLRNPDRYRNLFTFSTPYNSQAAAEFGSEQHALAGLCVQTLSFVNFRDYEDICKGLVLKGDYEKIGPNGKSDLHVYYDDFIAEAKKSQQDPGFSTKRICAYRDWGRKNLVEWLTISREMARQSIQQEYAK